MTAPLCAASHLPTPRGVSITKQRADYTHAKQRNKRNKRNTIFTWLAWHSTRRPLSELTHPRHDVTCPTNDNALQKNFPGIKQKGLQHLEAFLLRGKIRSGLSCQIRISSRLLISPATRKARPSYPALNTTVCVSADHAHERAVTRPSRLRSAHRTCPTGCPTGHPGYPGIHPLPAPWPAPMPIQAIRNWR